MYPNLPQATVADDHQSPTGPMLWWMSSRHSKASQTAVDTSL